jgi:spermidine synthase
VLILFCIPVTLLGTISPFAIRLAIRHANEAGMVSGRVYAISTLGSFIGTFLPVLILIPLVGTTWTFIISSTYLMIIALLGMVFTSGWRKVLPWLWMLVVHALLSYFGAQGNIKNTSGQIFETESAYNYIQVLEQDGYRYLRLNEGQGVHSIYHPEDMAYEGTWMQFIAAPFFNAPPYGVENIENMAIIGLAGGTIARQATEVYGQIRIDGFEIDPVIINVGRQYFGMTMPNLNAFAQDGRWGLDNSDIAYQIIAVDAYRPPYIPWHLTTREFFRITREHLTEDGVLAVNVGRAPNDRSLIDAMVSTILAEYPSVHVMDVPGTFNSVVYATNQPSTIDNLKGNFENLIQDGQIHELLLQSIYKAMNNLQVINPSGPIFTDDLAPIEWIVNKMVLSYIMTGEYQDLQ